MAVQIMFYAEKAGRIFGCLAAAIQAEESAHLHNGLRVERARRVRAFEDLRSSYQREQKALRRKYGPHLKQLLDEIAQIDDAASEGCPCHSDTK